MGPVAADLGCSSFREEPKFADSSLEEDGFEPSVPLTGRRSLSRKDEVPKGRTGGGLEGRATTQSVSVGMHRIGAAVCHLPPARVR